MIAIYMVENHTLLHLTFDIVSSFGSVIELHLYVGVQELRRIRIGA